MSPDPSLPSRPSRRAVLNAAAAIGGLGGAGLLGGCATGGSGSSPSGKGDGRLSMHHDAAVGPLFAPFVAYFNKHYAPLKLSTNYVPQDYATVTNQQLAGGNVDYDILYSDEGFLDGWSKNNWITDIDGREGLDSLVSGMSKGVADACKGPDGKMFALPYFQGCELFVVNQAHLDKIKAKPPTTWEEFVSQADELKSKRIVSTPYSPYWMKTYMMMWHQFATECASEGGGELFDAKGKALFLDNDAARSTLKRWKTLYAKGLVPKDIFTTDYGSVTNIFGGGKSAFSMRYQAQLVGWKNKKDSPAADDITNVPMPGSTHETSAFGSYWMMAAGTPNKDEAWTVMDYLGGAGKDGSFHVPKELVAKGLGLQTGYTAVDNDPAVLKAWGKWSDIDALKDQLKKVVYRGPVTTRTWYPKFGDMASATLQEIVRGSTSIDEGLKQMTDFVEKQG